MSSTLPRGADQEGSKPRARSSMVGVTVICMLAGLLFGTSASLARESPSGSARASDLAELITARDQQVRELSERAEELRTEVDALRDARADSEATRLAGLANDLAPDTGLAAVSGQAVRVSLDDAGYSLDTLPSGYTVDDVVVHQQDLQGVVNALWAGGAEAIMVQDQRIVSTSAIKCVGNTLYLQGRVYSPPFVVTAIGDPEALHAALETDTVVSNYRQWSELLGLGYLVEDVDHVEVPAFSGAVRPQHATILSS